MLYGFDIGSFLFGFGCMALIALTVTYIVSYVRKSNNKKNQP